MDLDEDALTFVTQESTACSFRVHVPFFETMRRRQWGCESVPQYIAYQSYHITDRCLQVLDEVETAAHY